MNNTLLSKLKRDDFLLGGILGLVLPGLAFLLIFGIHSLLVRISGNPRLLEISTMVLISIFVNLFSLRYYLVNLKYDKTGRGILMVTFVLAIVFFVTLFRN